MKTGKIITQYPNSTVLPRTERAKIAGQFNDLEFMRFMNIGPGNNEGWYAGYRRSVNEIRIAITQLT